MKRREQKYTNPYEQYDKRSKLKFIILVLIIFVVLLAVGLTLLIVGISKEILALEIVGGILTAIAGVVLLFIGGC